MLVEYRLVVQAAPRLTQFLNDKLENSLNTDAVYALAERLSKSRFVDLVEVWRLP